MTTRAEFIELVAASLVRDEIPDAVMASWLRKGVKRINEELRVGEMLKRVVLSLTGSGLTLPADFIKARDVRLVADTASSGPLIFCTPAALSAYAAQSYLAGTCPGYYTVNGSAMELTPWAVTPGAYQVALWYYATIPALAVADDATNILTEKFEDLFLNAVLIYGHRHYFEDDRALLKDGLVQQEIARLNLTYEEAKYGDGPLVMQPSRKIGGRFS